MSSRSKSYGVLSSIGSIIARIYFPRVGNSIGNMWDQRLLVSKLACEGLMTMGHC